MAAPAALWLACFFWHLLAKQNVDKYSKLSCATYLLLRHCPFFFPSCFWLMFFSFCWEKNPPKNKISWQWFWTQTLLERTWACIQNAFPFKTTQKYGANPSCVDLKRDATCYCQTRWQLCISRDGWQLQTHLQRGEDYLVHGGEVGVPQHLGPLSEGQDSLVPHRSHRRGHLSRH